jgi:two-component system chemotaxis response regulator CheY
MKREYRSNFKGICANKNLLPRPGRSIKIEMSQIETIITRVPIMSLTSSQPEVPAPPPACSPEPLLWAQEALTTLIIDDQRSMRRIVRQLLANIHMPQTLEAQDGQQALDVLNDPKTPWIDLIICDLVMEGMDGIGFLNRLRHDEALRQRHIPVLILTAERDEMLLEVVRQVGAADVAHKPISSPGLRQKIEKLVGLQFS